MINKNLFIIIFLGFASNFNFSHSMQKSTVPNFVKDIEAIQNMANIQKAITGQKLSQFFKCLETVDYEWLKANKKEIIEFIDKIKWAFMNINSDMLPSQLSDLKKFKVRYIALFDLMKDGIEAIEYQREKEID